MNRVAWSTIPVVLAVLMAGCRQPESATQTIQIKSLTNGIQIVSVQFPESTNVSIFTFLPMGLTSDAPDQTQWSHLVEHLVIRSTVPAGSREANAETLPDHMRLDYYGDIGNWKEGLSHHRRWIEGVRFTEEILEAEKPKVISECEFTARNLATHKFAVAAWAQGYRHQKQHVALKGDVTSARLSDVQELRDQRLAVSNRITVCVVGGVNVDEVFVETEKQFGSIRLTATEPQKVESISTNKLNLTWDLDARHLLLTWPIPDADEENHAELLVAALWLNMQFQSDPELKSMTGMTLAGADLTTPEGAFLFVSASLKPDASFDDLRDALLKHVDRLGSDAGTVRQAGAFGRQLAAGMKQVPDRRELESWSSAQAPISMIEGNVGLRLGMQVHRYGAGREALVEALESVSPAGVHRAARTHLSPAGITVCRLQPARIDEDGK